MYAFPSPRSTIAVVALASSLLCVVRANASIAPELPLPTPDPTCGNGRFDWDEECDDGNLEAGDACPAVAGEDCRYSTSGQLIHGDPRQRRVRELGCLFEWYVVNPTQAPNRSGMPNERQGCRDQDPTCDFDPTPGRCEYRVVVCLNNEDVNLPECRPAGISATRVVRPRPSTNVRRAQQQANFLALANAIDHLHDPGDPHHAYEEAPALPPRERNYCSAPFPVAIDLARRSKRSEGLTVEVWDWDSEPRRKLRTGIKLTCEG